MDTATVGSASDAFTSAIMPARMLSVVVGAPSSVIFVSLLILKVWCSSPLVPIEMVMESALISTMRGSFEGVGVGFFLANAGDAIATININKATGRVLMV